MLLKYIKRYKYIYLYVYTLEFKHIHVSVIVRFLKQILDFELSDEEMKAIWSLDSGKRFYIEPM